MDNKISKKYQKQKIICQLFGNDFYEVIDNDTRSLFTARISLKSIDELSTDRLIKLSRELNIISKSKHPSILKFIDYSLTDFENQPKPVFFTEQHSDMTLNKILLSNKKEIKELKFTNDKKFVVIYGIALAMSYLHSHDIIHCNLNPKSIFLDQNFYPKLTNFGESQFLSEIKNNSQSFARFIGSLEYLAPEILTKKKYSKSSDVYAFSIILYEILSGNKYDGNETVLKSIKKNLDLQFVGISDFYKDLINKCSSYYSNERPTFDEILQYLKNDPNISKNNDFQRYMIFVNESAIEFDSNKNLDGFNEILKNRNQLSSFDDFTNNNDDPLFDMSEFVKQKKINREGYFDVFEIFNEKTEEKYSAKFSDVKIKKFYKNEIINHMREVNIIAQLNHPSIRKFIGYSSTHKNENNKLKPKPVIITEFLNCGDLNYLLKHKTLFNFWNNTLKLINIYGIATAMSYLHSHGIIHRDLKPENIFLDDNFFPKITNFNISKQLPQNISSQISIDIKGTPIYLAPEVFSRNEYSKASDVYSFAMIVYEIVTGKKPFFELTSINKIKDEIVNKKNRPKFYTKISNFYKKLIEKCWSHEPNERPTFDEIVDILRKDSNYIAENIDDEYFKKYVDFIDKSKIIFGSKKQVNFDEITSNIELFQKNDIHLYLVDVFKTQTNNIIVDFDYLDLINFEITIAELGKGSIGKVYIVKDKKTDTKYAAKFFNTKLNKLSLSNIMKYLESINNYAKANHPCLAQFFGYSPINFAKKCDLIIFFNYYKNGSLKNLIDSERKGLASNEWTVTKKFINIYGIALGMAFLHSHNIIHGNLHLDNILFDEFLYPKIIDFGFQYDMESKKSTKNGDIKEIAIYLAPEVITETKYTKSSDVYSYSMILYQLLTSLLPFPNFYARKLNIFQFYKSIVSGDRPYIPDDIPKCYKELLDVCWPQNPEDRITFDNIVHLLETKKDFRTCFEGFDEEEFSEYVKYIKQYKISFNFDHTQTTNSNHYAFKKVIINLYQNDVKKVKKMLVNVKHIDLQKYERLKQVGEGSFGIVYEIKDKETNHIYAAKISKDSLNFIDDNKIKNLEREVNIISILNYPSIMKFVGFSHNNFKNKPNPTIVTEFVSNISLKTILDLEKSGRGIASWNDTKKLINIFGISSAMAYLHSLNILHRDLKPDNILIDNNLYPKICDFGLSKNLSDEIQDNQIMYDFKGTIAYSAPEALKGEYSKAGDVYAFAVIVYEIMTNEEIFQNMNIYQVYDAINTGYRPKFRFEISKCYRKLIEDCWSENPNNRPNFEVIVETLKQNSEFITENVDLNEFLDYIDFIEEKQNISIETSKKLNSEGTVQKVTFNLVNSLNEETEKEIQELKKGFLDLNKFELCESFAKTSFYKHYKVISKETKETFIAKISTIKITKFSKDELINLRREVNIISQLNHPSFLRFIGYSPIDFKEQKRPVIITEMPLNGSLKQILESEKKNNKIDGWDETQRLINIYGIASAMSYLHMNKIIHRDLKPESIFLDEYLFPKIGDFGLATKHHSFSSMTFQSSSGVKGTPIYLAPEVIQSNNHTQQSDVYSFSLIVYEIVSHKAPFKGISTMNQIFNEVVTKCSRPEIDQSVPKCYKELIECCWSQNPVDRPSFADIVNRLKNNHEFITEKVRKKDYLNYIEFVEESIKEFQSNKKILCLDEFIKMKNKIQENPVNEEEEQTNSSDDDDNSIDSYSNNSEEETFNEEDKREPIETTNNLDDNQEKAIIEVYKNTNQENSESESHDENNNSFPLQANSSFRVREIIDDIENSSNTKKIKINEELETRESLISLNDSNLEEMIKEYISSCNPSNLMKYLHENCNDEKISDVFDHFYYSYPDHYIKLCEEGISLNNHVAHHKYAILLIFDHNNNTKQAKIEARKHLEISIEKGFKKSYFLLSRLLHNYFNDNEQAFKVAHEGSLKNDKYSKCLLGHFISKGIGTIKEFEKGIEMMLSSQASDYYERFATDIGLYYFKIAKNYEEAFRWFERAFINNKTKTTINNYGICFLKGIGVHKNIDKAKEIFTIGIQQNDANSKYHMAFILEKSDPELSQEYYKQSAREGNAHAKIKLTINSSKK